jgi:anti-anti-sigma factor
LLAAGVVVAMVTNRTLFWAVDESPDSLVLRVRGEVDPQTAPEFARIVRETVARGKATVIDLSAVTHFDSHGIGILREHANLTKATLRPSAQLRRTLQTMGIDYLFKFQ